MPNLKLASAAAVLAITALSARSAVAATGYPVNGVWTYNYSSASGPAKTCDQPQMNFAGDRRFDTGGSVPDYRNISVTPDGSGRFSISDLIFTGPVQNAHIDYTLQVIDADHISLALQSGETIQLRRCKDQ